jgi:hypothetical protein
MTQASIILNQLGGINRITAMTGAYNFLYVKTGVCFHFKSPKANCIKITINKFGEYDVTIGKINGINYKIIAREDGVYAENLIKYIENKTETRFSL